MQHLINRFISYVTIDSQSDANSDTTPSTQKQWNIAHKLVDDLKSIDVDSKVNDQFWEWIKKIYTSDKNGEVKILSGN